MPLKLKACPWCGWRAATLMVFDLGKKKMYSIKCNHCGFASKKSRFVKQTQYFWNHSNNPVVPIRKERKRYHIYGREF